MRVVGVDRGNPKESIPKKYRTARKTHLLSSRRAVDPNFRVDLNWQNLTVTQNRQTSLTSVGCLHTIPIRTIKNVLQRKNACRRSERVGLIGSEIDTLVVFTSAKLPRSAEVLQQSLRNTKKNWKRRAKPGPRTRPKNANGDKTTHAHDRTVV